jgi:ADP-heptose:LPS heptosyltransferase
MRVGYPTDFRRALLTHPVDLPPPGLHHVDQFGLIARSLGCPIRDPDPFFHLTADDRRRAGERLGDRAGSFLVALHPGASKPERGWHAERFALLGRRFVDRLGARLLLLGGPADGELLRLVSSGLPPGAVLETEGGLPLRDLAAILERCGLFVGNDSGPMHVAAALGVPTVGLFGPGSPRRTAPRGRQGRVACLWKGYPCSPCRQDFFRECPPSPNDKPFCLEEIGVDEVEEAAVGLVRSLGLPRAGGPRAAQPPGEAPRSE